MYVWYLNGNGNGEVLLLVISFSCFIATLNAYEQCVVIMICSMRHFSIQHTAVLFNEQFNDHNMPMNDDGNDNGIDHKSN